MIKPKKYTVISCYFDDDKRFLNDVNFIVEKDKIIDFIEADIEVLHGVKRLAKVLCDDVRYIHIDQNNCDFDKFIEELKWFTSISYELREFMMKTLINRYEGKNDFIFEIMGEEYIEDELRGYECDFEMAKSKLEEAQKYITIGKK